MSRITFMLPLLFYVACATTAKKWTRTSDLSAKTAYELLGREVDRCFPKENRKKYFLNEIGEYQIKVYRQSTSLNYSPIPSDALYIIHIRSKDAGSAWEISSVLDSTLIDQFEKRRRLCD